MRATHRCEEQWTGRKKYLHIYPRKMGLSDDGDDSAETGYEDLCMDLNLDKTSKEEAWQSFEAIRTNYTLEGDSVQWLACAVYVACRKSVPTVRGGEVEGNCVSLTRLLRSAKLSLLQFFNKMKKWADMANLPQDFREKVDRLERNFAVSTVIFKKYQPIFLDIFRDPTDDPPRTTRSRKQRRLPCTPSDVFSFCWTMFVQVKGNFPAISDDLVNSYHLLLCCIDWFYANAVMSHRTDLLVNTFSGLPKNFHGSDFKTSHEVPCIIQLLCDKHEGLVLEAKGIKEHWFKPYIKKLFDKKVLKGKVENLTGILDIGSYDTNSKAINNAYEIYVLGVGDFDERIFLGEDANAEIGTPAKPSSSGEGGAFPEKVTVKKDLKHSFETKSLTPSTPLTGRRYLKDKQETPITPVSTATQSVSRLQTLLAGRKTCPSEALEQIFESCSVNPGEEIANRVKQMGEIFCTSYGKPSDEHAPAVAATNLTDFAKRRLQLGESLYYKTLETIMLSEKRRLAAKDKQFDFSSLLEQDVFHRSLFACCLEIVIFSYNSQKTFPWIVDIYNLAPFYFYKVIEVLIRAEEGLSRDVVKHLNHIEETILESGVWKANSVLWETIIQTEGDIPKCEDVTLPYQFDKEDAGNGGGAPPQLTSPVMHPALRRIACEKSAVIPKKESLLSPTAADRFSSPAAGSINAGSAKRRLFTCGPVPGSATSMASPIGGGGGGGDASGAASSQQIITFQQAQTEDGTQVLIPVKIVGGSGVTTTAGSGGATGSSPKPGSVAPASTAAATPAEPAKPKRTGSLALLFRKVYHLASVRLRDLCEKLDITPELRSQIWTCFEHCLTHHIDLMQDRHLDQILMCSVYVMAKVTARDKPFQEIMRCYRVQPQAKSHVYRSVLISSRKRRSSGSSASGSNSPATVEEAPADKKKKFSAMRSTSTLPVPTPSSHPPTPTRLAGTGSTFDYDDKEEERGDLIQFYNKVYVKKIRNFAVKFSSNEGEAPLLSPLPAVRAHPTSPRRRVSSQHSVYISPHKNSTPLLTPHTRLLYCFNKSPAKDLRAINNMLRHGDKRQVGAGKRVVLGDANSEAAPPKQMRIDAATNGTNAMQKRIIEVLSDRQASAQ